MSNKILNSLACNAETKGSTDFQFATTKEMLSCIAEAKRIFEDRHPDKKDDIDAYFSLWKEIFERVKDNVLDDASKEAFQYPIQYPFLPCCLYAAFDIEAIRNDAESLAKTTLSNADFKDLLVFPTDKALYQSNDLNKPIVICDSLSAPILIDGRERYLNSESQSLDVPVYVLPYTKLNKQHFINEFNFAVFIFAEEVNACSKSFDEAALMHSYLRIGNKIVI